jgi:hypothetical protein
MKKVVVAVIAFHVGRVTRLAEFSSIGRLFSCTSVLKFTEEAPICVLLFVYNSHVLILTEIWLGKFIGAFMEMMARVSTSDNLYLMQTVSSPK